MLAEKPVFFHFDFNFAPGEGRLEIRIDIPDGILLVLREFHVQLEGDGDLSVEQAWCVLTGGGESSGNGLRVTANGAAVPPLRPPFLLLNHITATTVPANDGRLFVIGPSNVYLPAIESVRALCIRYPTTVPAIAAISVTGVIRPYDPYEVSSI